MTSHRIKAIFSFLFLSLAAFYLSGCVYFNTYYNAQKAYDQAIRLHEKRFEKNPEDSILSSPDEKLKLERAITKASKVLELYPNEKKYQPKALFLIGECYLAEGEYAKAILKYEELQRFYPQAEEMPIAEFHRAKSLFLNGQYPFAQTALEKVLATTTDAEVRAEALVYLAKLQVTNNDPLAALDLYEKLLKSDAHSPEAKAQVHFEAAKIAFEIKQWERARGHAVAIEIKTLPSKMRYRMEKMSAECFYKLNRVGEGLGELQQMRRNRLYTIFFPEMDLKIAEGYFLLGKPDQAMSLLLQIPKNAPKTAFSAEAFYKLGDYQLTELKKEKEAKVYFDSAAAAGSQFEYAILALERSRALFQLVELRKSKDTTTQANHYREFMIAELFLFRLDNVDSALKHLDRIVEDPKQDSSHSMRAAYARAFIQGEFNHAKPVGDSLYQIVMQKYPRTEYAKQAERNLGLKPAVQTDEDEAHKLFLEAEALRFGGSDLITAVIPAYAKVVQAFGNSKDAAKAQFVIAMLYDQLFYSEDKVAGSRDSAIAAYSEIRDRFSKTNYYAIATLKLDAAGIKPKPKIQPVAVPKPGPGNLPASGNNGTGNSSATGVAPNIQGANGQSANGQTPVSPSSPNSGSNSSDEQNYRGYHGGHENSENNTDSGLPNPTAAPSDTGTYQPEGKVKEEIDKGYENVDQY